MNCSMCKYKLLGYNDCSMDYRSDHIDICSDCQGLESYPCNGDPNCTNEYFPTSEDDQQVCDDCEGSGEVKS